MQATNSDQPLCKFWNFHATRLSSSRQQAHHLQVVRLREHVQKLDTVERVAQGEENLEIAGEGAGVARDVGDAASIEGFEDVAGDAGAGRVDDGEVPGLGS